ncbi:unnamed protein product, partial [Prorocentrum cordatum]
GGDEEEEEEEEDEGEVQGRTRSGRDRPRSSPEHRLTKSQWASWGLRAGFLADEFLRSGLHRNTATTSTAASAGAVTSPSRQKAPRREGPSSAHRGAKPGGAGSSIAALREEGSRQAVHRACAGWRQRERERAQASANLMF